MKKISINTVIFVFLFFVNNSVLARLAVKNNELSDILGNFLNDNIKSTTQNAIHIDLPTEEPTNDVTDTPDEKTTDPHIDANDQKDEKTLLPLILGIYLQMQQIWQHQALILTPFIKEGRIEEARSACKVDPELFLGFESYSGFFTVNETYDSNLFFWYFPVENKPVNETPWIIWLQGGPGASSMTGLFDEIGPFYVDSKVELNKNPHTWLRNHSLLFIDNPVGTGFSFTNHVDGYSRDMNTYATHLYTALRQFMQIFPELRTAPLFVAGESYGGKYVPALAEQIHRHREQPGADINLQGLIVGNGYVDPAMIADTTRPFYYFGLLESEQIETMRPLITALQQDIANNRSTDAKLKWNHLITILLLFTHQNHAYNFLKDNLTVGRYMWYLKRWDVRHALHVGTLKFNFVNGTTNAKLNPDFLSSAKPLYEELLEHYRVLTYCGQLDQMLSCVLTSENYRTWKWNNTKEFLEATRYPYIYNNTLSGYHKSGGHLTEVVIRGAGHMAPMDAPAPLQELVARWVRDVPLSKRFGILDGSFVQEYIRNITAVGAPTNTGNATASNATAFDAALITYL